MSIKVTCEVTEYSNKPSVKVHNDWSEPNKVQIETFTHDGVSCRYTVVGKDLIEAIHNCMNVNRGW